MLADAIHSLARAWGRPPATGRLRLTPGDFAVREIPLLQPAGAGEHVWLLIRKCGENTQQVAQQLAKLADVPLRDVSFAGLKDRQAVTEQWFSVRLPGRDAPDWAAVNSDTLKVIEHARHSRKLRRGALRGNRFRICIRAVAGERAAIERRLQRIAGNGVPNYFGEQRFGRQGGNLRTADRLFANPRVRLSRNQRGLALSAVRAFLFNQVLSQRVSDGTWNLAIAGDAMQLAGSHSFFVAGTVDSGLSDRVASHDIHPTGPLHGKGDPPVQAACRALEDRVLCDYPTRLQGLESAGLRKERRALRLIPSGLEWSWESDTGLMLEFALPAGGYATCVLRELVSA
ncbi:MAG: tRNA pseudouridine(13) synthase TruD [Gammaproteobacteria bacterium]